MSSAPQYVPYYSVSDYQQWEGDWELLQGVAIAMTPSPFGAHQALAPRLASALVTGLSSTDAGGRAQCHCVVLQEIDWIVDDHTVVRPDIVVVCDGVPERHLEVPPTLIVEILSPSTAEKDRIFKLDLYQRQGVLYYVLADPNQKRLEVFHRTDGQYIRQPDSPVFEFQLHADCGISLDCETIFR